MQSVFILSYLLSFLSNQQSPSTANEKKKNTSEPEVIDSFLSTDVGSPTNAESSKEATFASEIPFLSFGNRRIPAGNSTLSSPELWLVRSIPLISWVLEEFSSELMIALVEDNTRGFLLSTITAELEAKLKP